MNKIKNILTKSLSWIVSVDARVVYANIVDNLVFFFLMFTICYVLSLNFDAPFYSMFASYFVTILTYSLLAKYAKTPAFFIFKLSYERIASVTKGLWVAFNALWFNNMFLLLLFIMGLISRDGLNQDLGWILVTVFCLAVWQWCYLLAAITKYWLSNVHYIQEVSTINIRGN